MKLTDTNSKSFKIIARYLANEMSDIERIEFENEVRASQEKSNFINAMKRNWTQIGQVEEDKTVDVNKAWDKLYNRLDSDNLLLKKENVSLVFMPQWLKYAASFVLILSLGGIAAFFLTNKPKEEIIAVQTQNEENTLVQTLSDGSVVYVASNSTFAFPQEFEKNERKVTLQGEAFFDISRNPQKPFIIETEKVIIEVLGTAFNVKTTETNQFELTVERGKVRVTMKNDAAQSYIVLPGEKITSVNNHLEKKSVGNYKFIMKQQRIKFKDETLGNIIAVINKNYNSNIVIQNEELKNKRITVTFYNNSLSTVTELICTYLDLKHEITPDSSIIITPNNN